MGVGRFAALEPQPGEHLQRSRRPLGALDTLHLEPEGGVVEHGHPGEQALLLEDQQHAVGFACADRGAFDDALGRLQQAGEHAQQGALAAAARADDRQELALTSLEAEPRDGFDRPLRRVECQRQAWSRRSASMAFCVGAAGRGGRLAWRPPFGLASLGC